MRRINALLRMLPLGLIAALGACSAGEASDPVGNLPEDQIVANAASSFVDVQSASTVSFAMRGGAAPIVDDQTIERAVVTLDRIELVGADGSVVTLLDRPQTFDLLALQNDLSTFVQGHRLEPGRYTGFRCHLAGAWVEAVGPQGTPAIYATPGLDPGQFAAYAQQVGSVQTLQLAGMESGGWFRVGLPPDGLVVRGAATLAFHLDLSQSLYLQDGAWVFAPYVWCVDADTFSSLAVEFASSQSEFYSYVQQGFQVALLDAGLNPVAYAPITPLEGGVYGAQFQYLEPFGGPYVAVLVPPAGYSIASAVSVSVDLRASVRARTVIDVSGFSVSGRTLDIRTANEARFFERTRAGRVIAQTTRPVGPIRAVAPLGGPREPFVGHRGPRVRERAPRFHGLPAPEPIQRPHRPGFPGHGGPRLPTHGGPQLPTHAGPQLPPVHGGGPGMPAHGATIGHGQPGPAMPPPPSRPNRPARPSMPTTPPGGAPAMGHIGGGGPSIGHAAPRTPTVRGGGHGGGHGHGKP